MAISGTVTTGNDTFTVTPTGFHSVNGDTGVDTLVIDYSTLVTDIVYESAGYGWYRFTDSLFSGIEFYNIERFNITGGKGDDQLIGLNDADTLIGGAGYDVITSGLGADVISGGGGGSDRWIAGYSSLITDVSYTLLSSGWASIAATGATVRGIEQLTMTTGIGNDAIDTSAVIGDDSVNVGDGDNSVNLGRGHDTAQAGSGEDLLTMDWSHITNPNKSIIHSFESYGWERYAAGAGESLDFYGFDRFELTGGAGADSLRGGDLNDMLSGGGGNDFLKGDGGMDTIHGGGGTDTWELDTSASTDPVRVDLNDSSNTFGATFSGIEQVNYTGGDAADTVIARVGIRNDDISTGDGNDKVTTGRGRDVVNGGGDTDKLIMDWSAITDPLVDIMHSYEDYAWQRYRAASGDMVDFYGFEKFDLKGGAGDDYLRGAGLNDRLVGNAGNDTLNGGAGIDTIRGGDGVDLWHVDTSAGSGTVTTNLNTDFTSMATKFSAIEQLSYVGGNANDKVVARSGVFDDTISTGEGNDTIVSGRGRDEINGGNANDKLIMDWSAITDPGHDIVHSYEDYAWQRYTSLSGDVVDFYGIEKFDLTGGAGNDHFVGGNLVDVMLGKDGDDTLDSAMGTGTIKGGNGTDHWIADLSDLGKVNLDLAASQSTAQMGGIGLNVRTIERVTLSTGNKDDLIRAVGYSNDDSVSTGAGNDKVDLGLGHDTFNGEEGVDTLIIDYSGQSEAVTSRAMPYAWARYATQSDSHYVDYINVEKFVISGGSGDDGLIGGALNDKLFGNAGDDTLTGDSGNDTIDGGTGNDTWIGDFAGTALAHTLVMDAAGDGTVINGTAELISIENIQIETSEAADMIDLSALAGNDIVNTYLGDDTVNMGRGYFEQTNGGAGTDTLIADFSMADSGIRITAESYGWWKAGSVSGNYALDFINYERVNFTGGDRNDRLTGFGDNDTLSGGAGIDILDGKAGDDVLYGGADQDAFVFTDIASAGIDTIMDGETSDLIRVSGTGITALSAGDGSGVFAGQVNLANAGGQTMLYVGTDGTAGYELEIVLDGTFSISDFTVTGGDLFFA